MIVIKEFEGHAKMRARFEGLPQRKIVVLDLGDAYSSSTEAIPVIEEVARRALPEVVSALTLGSAGG